VVKESSQVSISELLVLSCLVALGVQAWLLFPDYGPGVVLMAAWLLLILRCRVYKNIGTSAVEAFILLLVFYLRFREGAGMYWWLAPYFLADASFYVLLLSFLHLALRKAFFFFSGFW
jgi:hypothetical protein